MSCWFHGGGLGDVAVDGAGLGTSGRDRHECYVPWTFTCGLGVRFRPNRVLVVPAKLTESPPGGEV